MTERKKPSSPARPAKKKAKARKAPARKKSAARSKPRPQAKVAPEPAAPSTTVSVEERRAMIREAAYYKAAQRGFVGGDPSRDWIEAETEIDALLSGSKR